MNQDAGGNSGSTSGGQPTPAGGQPTPGGGPQPPHNDGSLAWAGGGLPHSNTDNSIGSNVSYTKIFQKQVLYLHKTLISCMIKH